MSLFPHIHLLIPSSTPSIHLEARVYLPPSPALPLDTSSRSNPKKWSDISDEHRSAIRVCGDKVVVASHPWEKLGGNMLDPVLADHLVTAIYEGGQAQQAQRRTALITFNARGVGRSEGSMGWLGLSYAHAEKDFEAMEQWAISAFEVKELRRVGYSWGCVAALNAPLPTASPIHSILLVSPAITFFRLTTLWASKTFVTALQSITATTANTNSTTSDPSQEQDGPRVTVWMVHGTQDEFTGTDAYIAMEELGLGQRLVRKEIEGADHLWRTSEQGDRLEGVMREWLAV